MNWYNDLSIDDIPSGKMQEIAATNGLFDAISLMRNVPGLQLYIPVYGKKKIQHDYVKCHYNGKNLLTLAVKVKLATKKVLHHLTNDNNYKKPAACNNYMQEVINKCGEGLAIRLIDKFAGEKIYIPLLGFSNLRKNKIISNFRGDNTIELALKYNVSERHVRQIVANNHNNRNAIQQDLFHKTA